MHFCILNAVLPKLGRTLLLLADTARLRLRCRVARATEFGSRGELCALVLGLAAPSTCVTLEATTHVGDLV